MLTLGPLVNRHTQGFPTVAAPSRTQSGHTEATAGKPDRNGATRPTATYNSEGRYQVGGLPLPASAMRQGEVRLALRFLSGEGCVASRIEAVNGDDLTAIKAGPESWDAYVRRMRSTESGWRADLTGADLRMAHLAGADLTGANLRMAHLAGADLTRANLMRAHLADADLTRVDLMNWVHLTRRDLTRADLASANLTDADLTRADLTRADLTDANLTRANLTDANLTRANLTRANLTDANLTRADLTHANLTRANLTDANLTVAVTVSVALGHDVPISDVAAITNAVRALCELAVSVGPRLINPLDREGQAGNSTVMVTTRGDDGEPIRVRGLHYGSPYWIQLLEDLKYVAPLVGGGGLLAKDLLKGTDSKLLTLVYTLAPRDAREEFQKGILARLRRHRAEDEAAEAEARARQQHAQASVTVSPVSGEELEQRILRSVDDREVADAIVDRLRELEPLTNRSVTYTLGAE